MKNKKKKEKYIDDGHTIYDMSGLSDKVENKDGIDINRKERFAMIKAAFIVYTPRFLIFILGLVLAIILIAFWLN